MATGIPAPSTTDERTVRFSRAAYPAVNTEGRDERLISRDSAVTMIGVHIAASATVRSRSMSPSTPPAPSTVFSTAMSTAASTVTAHAMTSPALPLAFPSPTRFSRAVARKERITGNIDAAKATNPPVAAPANSSHPFRVNDTAPGSVSLSSSRNIPPDTAEPSSAPMSAMMAFSRANTAITCRLVAPASESFAAYALRASAPSRKMSATAMTHMSATAAPATVTGADTPLARVSTYPVSEERVTASPS